MKTGELKTHYQICSFLLCMFFLTSYPSSADSAKIYQGAITQNELLDSLERLGIRCALQDGHSPTLVISRVRLGSRAFYQGASIGDLIKGLEHKNGTINLSIERSGKHYQLNFEEPQANIKGKRLKASTSATISLSHPPPIIDVGGGDRPVTIDVGLEKPRTASEPHNLKVLSGFDIEIMIDTSGSMNVEDGTDGLSKFSWCGKQVSTLAERLTPFDRTLTVTSFSNEFFTKERCNRFLVEQVFRSTSPAGGTDLLDPLIVRCEACHLRYKATGHPQLIVIISDGEPNLPPDPMAVNRALIDFSRCLSKQELTIAFLQVEETFTGKAFCRDLDQNLKNEGAQFNLVHTTTFAELKSIGIVDALLKAIRELDSM